MAGWRRVGCGGLQWAGRGRVSCGDLVVFAKCLEVGFKVGCNVRSYTEQCGARVFGLRSALEVLDTFVLCVMRDNVSVSRTYGWFEPDVASLLWAGHRCHR